MPGMHPSPDPDGGALLAWGHLRRLQDGDISFYNVTAKSHIPHSQKTSTETAEVMVFNNRVTNSIDIFKKIVHIKKKS